MKKIINHINPEWYRYGLETFVVIIGILVAFSLNNWNEQRKNKIEEINLLKVLQSDFTESKERLDQKIKEQQNVIYLSRRLLTIYENNELSLLIHYLR